MPPLRTSATPISSIGIKPLKTERTHEENQERAYIAASRRSDRSLEARIESARRASEIHKRRTGRSLRVTEQDVVNEEMYEEEDDDLPNQYRRLTAHLHTSNAEFDKRLAAYLTNHVAMRAALGQAVGMPNSSYPNAPSFASINNGMPGPFMSSFSQQSAMGPPLNTPLSSFSQSTLANPSQALNLSSHQRSASFADTQDLHKFTGQIKQEESDETKNRRLSLPDRSPPGNKRLKTMSNLKLENLPKMEPISPSPSDPSSRTPQPPLRLSDFPAPFHLAPYAGPSDANPFSTALPLESQQLLGGGAFDPLLFMTQPSFGDHAGMHQTLAPGCMDTPLDNGGGEYPMCGDDGSFFADGGGFDDYSGSGQGTPNDREWASFIDGNAWEEQRGAAS